MADDAMPDVYVYLGEKPPPIRLDEIVPPMVNYIIEMNFTAKNPSRGGVMESEKK